MRSIVVLPQPEGPTIAKKVPSSISSETSSTASSVRNRLTRCLIRILTGRLLDPVLPATAVNRPVSIG